MTLQQLQLAMYSYCSPIYVFGKDCSEYAEDVIARLGEGSLLTFVAKDRSKPLHLNYFGREQDFIYHTVVVLRCEGLDYVIDVTTKDRLVLKSQYILYIQSHCEGAIEVYTGEYAGMLY